MAAAADCAAPRRPVPGLPIVKRQRQQQGVALVLVLWMVSLLTLMAASFSLSTQRNTGLVVTAQQRAQGLALAEAGVHYALSKLQPTLDVNQRWRDDGRLYRVDLPEGQVRLAIFGESGKLDINAATEEMWRALLYRVTADTDQAAMLANRIWDWRDTDDNKRPEGAEAADYRAAGLPYGPQNRNFQAQEELQMVLGMPPLLYQRLEPLLTIYNPQNSINPQKASAAVLQWVVGLDAPTVADYIRTRLANPPTLPLPPLTAPPGGVALSNAGLNGDLNYTLIVQARSADGTLTGLHVLARQRLGGNGPPFDIISRKPLTAALDLPSNAATP